MFSSIGCGWPELPEYHFGKIQQGYTNKLCTSRTVKT